MDKDFNDMERQDSEHVIKEYEEELKDVVLSNSQHLDQLYQSPIYMSSKNPDNQFSTDSLNGKKSSFDIGIFHSNVKTSAKNEFSSSNLHAKDGNGGEKFSD